MEWNSYWHLVNTAVQDRLAGAMARGHQGTKTTNHTAIPLGSFSLLIRFIHDFRE